MLGEALVHARALHAAQPTPATRRGLAVTLGRLGQAHLAAGNAEAAAAVLGEALHNDRALHVAEPTPTTRQDLADTEQLLRRARGDDGPGGGV